MTARKGEITKKQKGLIKKAAKESKRTIKDAVKKSTIDKAIEYFSLGFDSYQIAVMLGIDECKLEKMCKDYPKLDSARKMKTLLHDAECRKAILDLATGKCKVQIEEQLLSTSGKPKYTRITTSTSKPELQAAREWLDMTSDDDSDNGDCMRISISFDGEES